MADNTRYQILFVDSSKVENFTAKQLFQFKARQAQLKRDGVRFTTWDTRRNPLSNIFKL
jgi:hypothetical protein